MRKSISLASCAVLCLSIAAAQQTRPQQTRREITSPSPADSKPNSAQVPDVVAIPARFDRVLILRFKYQTELLSGLERMLKEQHVKNAVILSAFGSVRNYSIHQVSNRDFPSKDMIVTDSSAPADIVGMSGFVMNGRLHAHISLANPEKGFAGHLEPGTNVFTFAVVTLGVLPDDVDVSRLDDKTWR